MVRDVTLTLTGSPLAENGGVATVTATLSAFLAADVTVNLGFTGTATNASDYTRSATSIVISAGTTTGSITLTGVDDLWTRTNETIVVDITTVTNGTESGTQQVTATITDDDAAPSVTLSLAGSPLAENGGVATVTATLSGTSPQDVTVNLGFTGTATSSADYTLGSNRYQKGDDHLIVHDVPAAFTLETTVRIRPEANTALEGLYVSNGIFCTQCEAEGFRRITYFPDRPDVMARYRVRIEADRRAVRCCSRTAIWSRAARSPAAGTSRSGRTPSRSRATCSRWSPAASPGSRTASRPRSGRRVTLEIYTEPREIDKCAHAMASLKKAMKWDEERFGLEYDLDRFMIVAVSDFNIGAMENKGLNIFNTKFVLARPETATDADYLGVESVIAPRVLPQLDRQPRDLPRLVPALPEGRADRLPRPGVHRATCTRARSSASRTCAACAPRSSSRTRGRSPIRCARTATSRSTTSTRRPCTRRAPRSSACCTR